MDQDQEINLIDYIKVILKRKKLILSVFLVVVISTAIFSFLTPKIYKVDTIIEVGKIKNESIVEITGKIKDETIIRIKDKTIETPSQIVSKIQNDIYGILIKKNLGISEKEYPEIKVENPEGTDLIIMKIESEETEKAKNILKELNKLILENHKQRVDAENIIRLTKVIKEPTISTQTIGSKLLLNMLIAVILGLFLGIFLAFLQEWWERNKSIIQ
ncbi:hypothetical protein AMJ49_04745 [Parcubacteria bacterium DG_74_2]|nr:MAG: hypothetical protein AMJ49_04745 [Parcubacteria bacterium DG_74_2]